MTANEDIVKIKKKLEEHENRISELESLFRTKPEAVKKEVSIKEFLLSKKPKNDVQKTLAIGYYFENYQGLSSFNAKDLESGLRTAKEKVPKNIQDKVLKNVKKGHMMEAKEKKDNLKAYVLTISGEQLVENDFNKD